MALNCVGYIVSKCYVGVFFTADCFQHTTTIILINIIISLLWPWSKQHYSYLFFFFTKVYLLLIIILRMSFTWASYPLTIILFLNKLYMADDHIPAEEELVVFTSNAFIVTFSFFTLCVVFFSSFRIFSLYYRSYTNEVPLVKKTKQVPLFFSQGRNVRRNRGSAKYKQNHGNNISNIATTQNTENTYPEKQVPATNSKVYLTSCLPSQRY